MAGALLSPRTPATAGASIGQHHHPHRLRTAPSARLTMQPSSDDGSADGNTRNASAICWVCASRFVRVRRDLRDADLPAQTPRIRVRRASPYQRGCPARPWGQGIACHDRNWVVRRAVGQWGYPHTNIGCYPSHSRVYPTVCPDVRGHADRRQQLPPTGVRLWGQAQQLKSRHLEVGR